MHEKFLPRRIIFLERRENRALNGSVCVTGRGGKKVVSDSSLPWCRSHRYSNIKLHSMRQLLYLCLALKTI